ncbi:hypothetical protein SDJN02_26687, partial [Cucurbita argyrosperma subsp. argyrosperma]
MGKGIDSIETVSRRRPPALMHVRRWRRRLWALICRFWGPTPLLRLPTHTLPPGSPPPPFQPPPPSSPPPPSLNSIEEQPKTRTHPDLPLYNLCNSSPSSDLHSFLLLLLLLRLVLLDCS